jgi:hypothetical protein
MKRVLLSMLLGLAVLSARAHDEGHGPKLTDQGRQGGVMAPVIDARDRDKGAKAAVVYKGELLRSEDGTVRVYLYDADMAPLDLARFAPDAGGVLEVEKKKKVTTTPFALKVGEDSFIGTSPKPAAKPFNIDVTLKEGERGLLVAFDNLD